MKRKALRRFFHSSGVSAVTGTRFSRHQAQTALSWSAWTACRLPQLSNSSSPSSVTLRGIRMSSSRKQSEKAREVYAQLAKYFDCEYDESGSIGKRYRRQDAIGTPLCITIDNDTETTGEVTVRNRDTMQQEHVKIADLKDYVTEIIEF